MQSVCIKSPCKAAPPLVSVRYGQCRSGVAGSRGTTLQHSPGNNGRLIVAQAEADAATKAPQVENTEKSWNALLAYGEWLFHDVQNEAFAEQLRERKRHLVDNNEEIDFFLVPEPAWLDKFPEAAKQVRRPCVAIVSSNDTWLTFMKLRLDRVLRVDLQGMSKEEAIKQAGELPDYGDYKVWRAPYTPYQPDWWKVFLPDA